MFYKIFPIAIFSLAIAALALDARAQSDEITNSIGMEFVLIPAGSFIMGSNPGSNPSEWNEDEGPARKVTISAPFYLGKYPVTQKQWEFLMGSNPSEFRGQDNPVEMINWRDANAFIAELNLRERTDAYRLPTEAEWEFSARAGTTTEYFFGDTPERLGDYAWYYGNADGATHPVGLKAPNPWGLFDILGNVWEWGSDWYDPLYYENAPSVDPQGPANPGVTSFGPERVRRGCTWDYTVLCRSANRSGNSPESGTNESGFRVVFTPRQAKPEMKN
ncbi:MAG: formylglycine-generating enzyme family protein [Deltaproteobacteria bacterium]|nr:formylglycine-generating enzyme family protein [Deltaproteobacteria bacterium]